MEYVIIWMIRKERMKRVRLELSFVLKNAKLPVDNKRIWVSFLKKALTQCGSGRFYDRYFNGTPNKDYTFSIILPKPKFQGNTIILEENTMKMIFSADDRKKTGLIFFQAFIQAKETVFPLPDGNNMVLKKIIQLPEKLITSERVVFRTVTGGGLVIRKHNRETNKDQYFSFEDEGFTEQMKEVLGYQARGAGFNFKDGESVEFIPIQCKKVLVKQLGINVDVTCGIFELQGNPELLQYFYQAGMGSRHSMGYGMLEVVAESN